MFYRKLPTYNPQFTKGKPYKCFNSATNITSGNYTNYIDMHSGNDGEHYYPRDVKKFSPCRKPAHPQQKPTALLEYLIRTYTNEGELVLDATMGSGSTGVACVNTKRRFVGIELEKKYYDIAQERIEKALALKRQELF